MDVRAYWDAIRCGGRAERVLERTYQAESRDATLP